MRVGVIRRYKMCYRIKIKVLKHCCTRKSVIALTELALRCNNREVIILATSHVFEELGKVVQRSSHVGDDTNPLLYHGVVSDDQV